METEQKPVLSHAQHAGVVDLVLWAGQLMQQHGAESQLVENTVYRLGTGLGCDGLDVVLTPTSILVCSTLGDEALTRARRIREAHVNMTTVSCIVRLCSRVEQGLHAPDEVRSELERIVAIGHNYARWQIVLTIGISCAAFCKLFGGGWPEVALTFLASGTAMALRQQMALRHVNPYLNAAATAFVATLIASAASVFGWGEKPDTALAASVLLLIPGVAFINSIQDLLKGYTVMGLARWSIGTLITAAIAIGMVLALTLSGVAL